MNLALILSETDWEVVTSINKRTVLRSHSDSAIRALLESSQKIDDMCGCYAWATRSTVYQCTCFSDDYKALGFKSNLEGVLHYSFAGDTNPISNCASTSEQLFQRMNEILSDEDLYLNVLRVDSVQVGKTYLNHDVFSQDPILANAITGLVVYYYRQRGQCAWH